MMAPSRLQASCSNGRKMRSHEAGEMPIPQRKHVPYTSMQFRATSKIFCHGLDFGASIQIWWISQLQIHYASLGKLKCLNMFKYPKVSLLAIKTTDCNNWIKQADRKNNQSNYFTSSDPHHDISKQLVDTTFVHPASGPRTRRWEFKCSNKCSDVTYPPCHHSCDTQQKPCAMLTVSSINPACDHFK